jgi:hypothetical protein
MMASRARPSHFDGRALLTVAVTFNENWNISLTID